MPEKNYEYFQTYMLNEFYLILIIAFRAIFILIFQNDSDL